MICRECGEDRPETEFHWKVKPIVRTKQCKECQKAYNRRHYARNPEMYKSATRRNKAKYVKRNSDYLFGLLAESECVVCRESDVLVLEMHHDDPDKKEYSISQLVTSGYPLWRVKEEVEKCTILCANCHKRGHYYLDEFGHRKLRS